MFTGTGDMRGGVMDSRLRYWDYNDNELFPFVYKLSRLKWETWFEKEPPYEGDNREKCPLFGEPIKTNIWERGALNKWASRVRLLKEVPFNDPGCAVEYVTLEMWLKDRLNPLTYDERMAQIKYFTEGYAEYGPDKTYARWVTGYDHPDKGGAPGYRDKMSPWEIWHLKTDPQLGLFN